MKTLIRNGRIVTTVDDYKADVLIEAVLIGKGGLSANASHIPRPHKGGVEQ